MTARTHRATLIGAVVLLVAIAIAGCARAAGNRPAADVGALSSSEIQTAGAPLGASCTLPPMPDGTTAFSSADPFPYAAFDFWQLHGAGTTYINYEIKPSFTQLVRSADLVVAGRITAATVLHPARKDWWVSITDLPLTLVTVTDRSGTNHRFSLVRINSPDCVLEQPLPEGEYVFVLDRTDEAPATADCADVDCVLRVIPGRGVDSVLVGDPDEPDNPWGDTEDIHSVDELLALARSARHQTR